MSLKEKMFIDKYNLDKEAATVAMEIEDYGEQNVDLMKKRDKQKLKLDIIEAELQEELRKNWKDLGYDKAPTAPQATAFINLNKKYQDESHRLIDINTELRYTSAALTSLDKKSGKIDQLIKLFLTGYWADQSLSAESVSVLNERMNSVGRRRKPIKDEEEE
jgi:hypothetical protein